MNKSDASLCDDDNDTEIMLELIENLKDPSFNLFIAWNNCQCIISKIDLFETIILPVYYPGYNLKDFLNFLYEKMIEFEFARDELRISFPFLSMHEECKKIHRKRLRKTFGCKCNRVDLEDSIDALARKLEKAIKINGQIHFELNKTKLNQKSMIEKRDRILKILKSEAND